ncbi:hypothetical protein HTIA_1767 [Halorhabdus tiamatea SARL4B]|uniref:Uncharacterized protein n=1 Tax=Halorhabdus tiamatea SARL4B TaxID=1033806 RepID=S6D8Q8_9EURY|nr:hypothetical protein HTIA_1767 [Halorhabdus tiamatea SARL4B]
MRTGSEVTLSKIGKEAWYPILFVFIFGSIDDLMTQPLKF